MSKPVSRDGPGAVDPEKGHEERIDKISDKSSTDSNQFVTDEDSLPEGYFKSRFFIGTMLGIGLGLMAGVAGFGFAAPILGIINADIGPDPNIVWVALVYTLTSAVTLTIIGRLSDIFGRRWIFVGGAALGVLGCIICSVATNVPMLIGGMTIIGVAAATQLSYFYVMGELVPMKYRLAGNGFCYLFCIPGSGIAPILAQAFLQNHPNVGWRGLFYLNTAINAASLFCWFFFYHPPTFEMKHGGGAKFWDYMRRFDYVGTAFYTGGLLIFMMGLNWGGGVYAWDSANVIATIVVGFVALVVFVLWECYARLSEPLVRMRYFRHLPWVASTVLTGLGASVYYAFAIVWPSMVAVMYTTEGHSTFYTAWLASIVSLFMVAGQIVGGFLGKLIGYLKWQCVVTFTIGGIAFATIATCGPDTPVRASALVGVGAFMAGWGEGTAITIVTLCAPDQAQLGSASGVAGSIRFLISSIAATVYSVVLSNRLAVEVPAQVPGALVAAGLPEGSVADFMAALTTGSFGGVAGLTDSILATGMRAYQVASNDAYRTVFLTNIAFSVVAIFCAVMMPDMDVHMTDKVATTLHQGKDKDKLPGQ
ncbi:MFS general substrate transporter [Sodiomyces alkalinus F11]|uniref:MFS general substrate transporter n=1 Tax=Sodiomyces alkalinus (strain CBS 110278 / VKM F-3762 / F11) TaxID=1314773 RepID=A0A3N2PYM2_SODAK|nr:MFS general substrate transporter [Sodiomyces alkalinus F11]ROT39633.1 MFS general substrate transporter [Sodiomyces alkalinus F11]